MNVDVAHRCDECGELLEQQTSRCPDCGDALPAPTLRAQPGSTTLRTPHWSLRTLRRVEHWFTNRL